MERVTRMRAKGDFLLQGPIIMGISAISHRRRLTSVPGQCNENISKRKRVSNRNCHYSPVTNGPLGLLFYTGPLF